jgi:MinD-like ATPase involved in chromosome partitioning or flagellar assembly
MSQIISINSFRRGAGCSNILANLAALLVAEGHRVGVVDTNIQSPGLHILFGLDEDEITATLYDYLWDRCTIEQIAHKISLPLPQNRTGEVYLIPTSTKIEEVTYVLSKGFDVKRLNSGLEQLVEALELDLLLIDTQPGLNEETLLSLAISDVLVILLRTQQQDYQGTALTVHMARELNVSRLMLIANEVPAIYDFDAVRSEMAQSYGCEIGAILPHSDRLMAMGGSGIFVTHYPDHVITTQLKQVAASLMT